MTGLVKIKLADIALGARVRPLNPVWVAALAEEIIRRGIRRGGTPTGKLKDPIEVRKIKRAGFAYEIVTGAHRLEAVKSLGWTEIEARVLDLNAADAKLVEIKDHLHRKSLTVLQMGRALSEMKRIYLEWYPETRNGANGGRGGKKNEMDNLSFSKKMAEALGLDRRSIDRYLSVFANIFPVVVAEIEASRHKIGDNQSELSRLGMVTPEERQLAVVNFIINPNHPAESVGEALAWLERRPVIKKDIEYRLVNYWAKADKRTRKTFIEYLILEGDLDAWGVPATALDRSNP